MIPERGNSHWAVPQTLAGCGAALLFPSAEVQKKAARERRWRKFNCPLI